MSLIYKIIGLTCVLGFISCEKQIIDRQIEVGNYIYEIDTVTVYTNSSEKTKQKSGTQFNRIVYSDIFRKGISARTLTDLDELRLAIGDNGTFNLLLIRSYLANPEAELPTNSEMENNPTEFINSTYKRLLLRNPTPYELAFMQQFIEDTPSLTVRQVYEGFIRSNEYAFY